MSEGVVNAFLFACVICPIFSSRDILERQSAAEVQPPPAGMVVGVGVDGRAAKEFVAVIDVNNMIMMTIGMAILNTAGNPGTSF
jgi:uncharacterized ferredoxin-like protein